MTKPVTDNPAQQNSFLHHRGFDGHGWKMSAMRIFWIIIFLFVLPTAAMAQQQPDESSISIATPPPTILHHSASVYAVAWNPAQQHGASPHQQLATGSSNHQVAIWNVETGQRLQTLTGHVSLVASVSWNPDGTQLASAGRDRTVRIWDTNTGQLLHTLKGHSALVTTVAWSNPIATSNSGTAARQYIASGSSDRTIRIWDASTGRLVRILQDGQHGDTVSSLAWNPVNTSQLASASGETVCIWNVQTEKVLQTLSHQQYDKTPSPVNGVAWDPVRGSNKLAVASGDNAVRIWNTDTGRLLQTFEGHDSSLYTVAWSPDGTMLATGSGDTTVRVWNATIAREDYHAKEVDGAVPSASTSLALLKTLQGHAEWVTSVAWSPDGVRLASASRDDTVRVWVPFPTADAAAAPTNKTPSSNIEPPILATEEATVNSTVPILGRPPTNNTTSTPAAPTLASPSSSSSSSKNSAIVIAGSILAALLVLALVVAAALLALARRRGRHHKLRVSAVHHDINNNKVQEHHHPKVPAPPNESVLPTFARLEI